MSTNLGLTANFKKKNPVVLAAIVTNTTPTPVDPTPYTGDFQELINSDAFRNKILAIIQSLGDSLTSLEVDGNPLDNIIKDELVSLLNYRKISKLKVQNALDLITKGQLPQSGFSADENLILLQQAKDLEYITPNDYNQLLISPSALYDSFPQVYSRLLNFQLDLPNSIPTLEELQIAGIVNFILTTVRANPEAVIDEDLVKYYTEHYIDTVLLTSEFIGYNKAGKILADPEYVLAILEKAEFLNLFNRVMSYLPFITNDKIDKALTLLPSEQTKITDIFTKEQIRLVIDKELDIKNIILKSLSLDEVTKLFNKLSSDFKVDFTGAFTNEKLMELIEITITTLYPPKTTIEIYNNIFQTLGLANPLEQKVLTIEEYLNQYYN